MEVSAEIRLGPRPAVRHHPGQRRAAARAGAWLARRVGDGDYVATLVPADPNSYQTADYVPFTAPVWAPEPVPPDAEPAGDPDDDSTLVLLPPNQVTEDTYQDCGPASREE